MNQNQNSQNQITESDRAALVARLREKRPPHPRERAESWVANVVEEWNDLSTPLQDELLQAAKVVQSEHRAAESDRKAAQRAIKKAQDERDARALAKRLKAEQDLVADLSWAKVVQNEHRAAESDRKAAQIHPEVIELSEGVYSIYRCPYCYELLRLHGNEQEPLCPQCGKVMEFEGAVVNMVGCRG